MTSLEVISSSIMSITVREAFKKEKKRVNLFTLFTVGGGGGFEVIITLFILYLEWPNL